MSAVKYRQARKQGFSKFSAALITLGFHHFEYDHSLFIKSHGSTFIVLLIYVDDIVLAGNYIQEINSVKHFDSSI